MASSGPIAQVPLLDQLGKAFGVRVTARLLDEFCKRRLWLVVGIFDVEHWLVLLDEGLKLVAVFVEDTLFLDAPLSDVDHSFEDIFGIFQSIGETVVVGGLGEELDVVDAVVFSEIKAAVV